MTHIISNLYASKIFAEHPVALWALDDEAYNPSLFTVQQKSISSLSIEDFAEWVSASSITTTSSPLPEESSAVLSRTDIDENFVTINGPIVSASALDPTKPTVCLNTFVYAISTLTDYYELGILYGLSGSATHYDKIDVNALGITAWQKLQFTSIIPNNAQTIQPIIKVKYIDGATIEEYDIWFNALSLGQWSEEFNWETTGNILDELTDNDLIDLLPDTNYKVMTADAYGFDDQYNGYYIVDNSKPLSINTSMPMVYGSGNITHIEAPITLGMPGLVIPGKGFLNESGRYQNRTFEFWLRTYSDMHQEFRIMGPLASTDGLYINQEYLVLKIGKNKKSYFIGKWFRPMLIDIKYSQSLATILLNGEEVLSMDIDQDYINFPLSNQDWIGFFGHSDLHPYDIDCIAIYPYLVPAEVAKRRFVYGQGVIGSEIIVNNFDGNSLYVDFPFANYAATMNYPETTTWNSGYFNNLNVTSKYIAMPEYELPELLHTEDIGDLDIYADNYAIQAGSATFFKFRPDEEEYTQNSYLYFNNIAKLSSPTKSIFGIFETTDPLINTKKTIMKFTNAANNNIFEVALNSSSIQYLYNEDLVHSASTSASQYFMVGLDLDKITSSGLVGNFFSNPQNVSLSVGGDGTNTFTGKIFNVTMNNKFFTDKDTTEWFTDNGFIDYDPNVDPTVLQYIGCYTFRPDRSSPVVYFDIASSGYWENSMPLSYFGKYITDKFGNSYYDLDMIQFNIDYSSNPIVNIPQHQNSQFENHALKSYITLQHYSQVGKIPYSQYSNIDQNTNPRVVDFDNSLDVISTKFEVVDGSVIFPPKELIDFEEYYITVHLEVKSTGIQTYPTAIPSMSLSSVVHNDTEFFAINTKTGNKIYPVVKYGNVYSHKSKNPFRIYKDSTPYLYLTGDSGIQCMTQGEVGVVKGFSIPINSQKSSEYIFGGMQLWLMYNQNEYISEPKKLGRIITPNKELDIFLIPEVSGNAKRGFIKVYDSETGYEDITIDFYQNGIKIQNPVIKPLMWTSLVMSFGESIPVNGVSGQLELYNGFVYNNMAFFKRSSLVLGQSINERIWQQVKTTEALINNQIQQVDLQWEDWYISFWLDLIERRTTLTYIIDGERIFGSFLGISNSIISDDSIVELESEGADVFSDIEWDQYVGKPV
jgi:hypothetical protein